MKKLRYLALLAIIILAGCKSNSFLNQRYTNLGHSIQKPLNNASEQINSDTIKPYVTRVTVNKKQTDELLVSSAPVKENKLVPQPGRILNSEKIAPKNSANPVKVENKTETKSESKSYKDKTTVQEKTTAAKGLIGGVLGLVLLIIVVVIIVIIVLVVSIF